VREHPDYIAQVLDSCRAGALDIQVAVQLALIGRYYERIGDHAVNIGLRVQYMVSGVRPERQVAP
jgi:phosphate transport system protein